MEEVKKIVAKAKAQLLSKMGDNRSAGFALLGAVGILMRKLEEKTPAPTPAPAPAPAPAPKAKAKAKAKTKKR